MSLFLMIDGSTYNAIFLGILVGTITTVVIQSSSATIGIAIALASQGLIGYVGAVSLVLGDNIGTTITAILASIGTSYNAKRAAVAHSLFNLLGVIWVTAIFFFFVGVVDSVVPGDPNFTIATEDQAAEYGSEIGTKPLIGQHIAMAHTMFNIANMIVFLPLVGLLVFLCQRIIPEPKGGAKPKSPYIVPPKYLNFAMVDTTSVSFIQSQNELNEMSTFVDEDISKIRETMENNSQAEANYKIARKNERILTNYKNNMNKFLLAVSEKELSEADAQEVLNHMAIAHSLDRMGYFSRKLSSVYRRMNNDKIRMSGEAEAKITEILNSNVEFYKDSMEMFKKVDGIKVKEFAACIPRRSKRIRTLIKDAKMSHFARVKKGICPEGAGLHYIDILNVLSNMQYQTRNLAEAVVGKEPTEEDVDYLERADIVGAVMDTVGKGVGKGAKETTRLLKKPLKSITPRKKRK
jgi:phosphate:Na+ symporter